LSHLIAGAAQRSNFLNFSHQVNRLVRHYQRLPQLATSALCSYVGAISHREAAQVIAREVTLHDRQN
jgi:hypothetical protein